jgi:hypothetical protein
MTPSEYREKKIEDFEENWRDRGDERYGLVKHNNTKLGFQLQWLRTALIEHEQCVKDEIAAKIETMMRDEDTGGFKKKNTLQNVINVAVNEVLDDILATLSPSPLTNN